MARGRSVEPGPTGAKVQAKRDLILDTAVAAFRRKGYAGTSTRDIGHALHLTKGSLYYYFRDKEDILFGCHERALDHLLSVARAVRKSHPDPESALRELIERHVGIMVHEFRGTALALEVAALTGPRLQRVVSRRDRYEGILRATLEEGVHSGAFRPMGPTDVKLASFAILGAINWMARWYREGSGASAEHIGRFFADLFVRAVRRSQPQAPRRRAETRGRPRAVSRPRRPS